MTTRPEWEGWFSNAPIFEDAIRAAADHHGLLPHLVRKDYWVTRTLRAVSTDPTYGGQCVFKGGTSLSKGWHLIDRFSEDIDLLLTGPEMGPAPATKAPREKHLKAIRERIQSETPLRLPDFTDEYHSRDDWKILCRFPLPGKQGGRSAASVDVVIVEAGFRGAPRPCSQRPLISLVADFIATRPDTHSAVSDFAGDLAPFDMWLLRPDRTFAEKLLRIHMSARVPDWVMTVQTRDYYDLSQLLRRSPEVAEVIASGELVAMLRDAVSIGNAHFGLNVDPATLDLRGTPALCPSPSQIRELANRYGSDESLYFKGQPRFNDLLADMRTIDDRLATLDWS